MKKSARIVAASLSAATLLGGTAVAANAQGFGHHSGHGSSHGHATSAGYGFGAYDKHWYRHHDGFGHEQLTFAQKQTLIVDKLDEAAARLQTKVDTLTIQETNHPSDRTAAALSRAQAKQTKLAALISAVKAATDDASLAAAFKSASGSGSSSGSPSPTASASPSA